MNPRSNMLIAAALLLLSEVIRHFISDFLNENDMWRHCLIELYSLDVKWCWSIDIGRKLHIIQ